MKHNFGRARALTCGIVGCALLLQQPAYAAQTSSGSESGAQTYLPADFERFAPRTALDMLRLVPGFVIADAEDRRGLGNTNVNVLIDGRPVPGKSTDAVDVLSRIAAAQVSRIELTSGASTQTGGLARQIANVVLIEAAASRRGQFSWRPSTRLRDRDVSWFNGDASVSGTQGSLEYSLGVRNSALRTGASGPSQIFSPSEVLIGSRDEFYVERSDRPRIGGSLRYETASGTIIGARASYQRFFYRFNERSDRFGEDLPDRTRLLTQRERDRRHEIAGDVEFELGAGRLKLIGLEAAERSPIDTRLTTLFSGSSNSTGTRFLRDADERERIFRSEYRWGGGQTDWLFSAERAVTSLDNLSTFFRLLADGSYEEVSLAGASGDVREHRHEAALAVSRRLSPQLTLQGSVGGEISQLRVAGDVGSRRTFRRPEGYVALAWQANDRLRANVKVERRVGQLSFFDFLASRNLLEERANEANPDLVPPQSWNVEGELTRDLGRLGSTTLRLYGHRIEDLVEQIPVGLAGEAPGNLDTAHLYGVDWKSSLFMDALGLAGVRLDARVQLQRSDVEDPVTGRSRRISNNLVRLLDATLRHDIPGTFLAWGGGLYHIHRAPDFRVSELARYREGPLAGNLFAEHKNIAGLTVRAEVSNLLSSRQELDRFVFQSRRDQPLLWIERRRRSVGPAVALAISGNF